jgi:hypothetical protein
MPTTSRFIHAIALVAACWLGTPATAEPSPAAAPLSQPLRASLQPRTKGFIRLLIELSREPVPDESDSVPTEQPGDPDLPAVALNRITAYIDSTLLPGAPTPLLGPVQAARSDFAIALKTLHRGSTDGFDLRYLGTMLSQVQAGQAAFDQALGLAANTVTFSIDAFEQNLRSVFDTQTVSYAYALSMG